MEFFQTSFIWKKKKTVCVPYFEFLHTQSCKFDFKLDICVFANLKIFNLLVYEKIVYNTVLYIVFGLIVWFTFLWIFLIHAMRKLTVKDWPGEVLLCWTIRNQWCALELFQYPLFSNIVGWTKILKRSMNGIYIYHRRESWIVRDKQVRMKIKNPQTYMFLASGLNFTYLLSISSYYLSIDKIYDSFDKWSHFLASIVSKKNVNKISRCVCISSSCKFWYNGKRLWIQMCFV